jgi:hypothetical protein
MHDNLNAQFPWAHIERQRWFWPVSMDRKDLDVFSLGWPGWRSVRGYHAGSKSGVTVTRNGAERTFVIDWAATGRFPESNVREVRKYPIQWEGASPELAS